MAKFKVGDRVRTVKSGNEEHDYGYHASMPAIAGTEGVVKRAAPYNSHVSVQFVDGEHNWTYSPQELELVVPADSVKLEVGDKVRSIATDTPKRFAGVGVVVATPTDEQVAVRYDNAPTIRYYPREGLELVSRSGMAPADKVIHKLLKVGDTVRIIEPPNPVTVGIDQHVGKIGTIQSRQGLGFRVIFPYPRIPSFFYVDELQYLPGPVDAYTNKTEAPPPQCSVHPSTDKTAGMSAYKAAYGTATELSGMKADTVILDDVEPEQTAEELIAENESIREQIKRMRERIKRKQAYYSGNARRIRKLLEASIGPLK